MSWRFRRRGILIESGLVVLTVVLAVGGMLWLRQRGTAQVDESIRVVQEALLEVPPTDISTYTPAPPPSETPAPNTPFPPTATPLPETITHVVVSGDTLYGIAIEYGVTLDDIVETNALSDSQSLSIGQELLVPVNRPEPVAEAGEAESAPEAPASSDEAAPAEDAPERVAEAPDETGEAAVEPEADPVEPAPAVVPTGEIVTVQEAEIYRVQPGDTLLGIAITHDMDTETLLDLNGFDSDETLSIGQEVLISPAEVATTTPPPPPPTIPSTMSEAEAPIVSEPEGDSMYAAPRLLAPGNATIVTAEAPLLRWSSAGVLGDDVYYVVSIRTLPDAERGAELSGTTSDDPVSAGQGSVGDITLIGEHDAEAELTWMFSNATAMRVPAAFRPAFGSSRTLEWSVTVRRRGAGLMGDRSGEIVSPLRRREIWRFTWAPGEIKAAPATD